MSLLFLFLDGIGIGEVSKESNPFVTARMPFLEKLLGGKLTVQLASVSTDKLLFKPIDARLGYAGLPQSATGQMTLLTGKNGADAMGRHYGPWPGPTIKSQLDKGTLFSEVLASGKSASLLNVYPPGYFRAVEEGKQKENVPVYSAKGAGLELLKVEDYLAQEAVSVDLTGEYLYRYDANIKPLSPLDMGRRLARLALNHDFSFFDYWPSDTIGHRGSYNEAVNLLEKLDSFFAGVYEGVRDGDVTVVITSDHGNLEDKLVKTHTLAPVPLIIFGNTQPFVSAQSIVDVAPAIRLALGLKAEAE